MKKGMAGLLTCFLVLALTAASCPKQDENLGTQDPAQKFFSSAEDHFQSGDYEEAKKLYQKIMEDHPLSGLANMAQFRTGQCYFKLGQTGEALSEFRRFVENNRDDSRVTIAQDYVIRIMENLHQEEVAGYEQELIRCEQENFRLLMLSRYLRRSVESEVIYVELDLETDTLMVRLGSQTLYAYPMVSGKGRRRLGSTGRIKDFSTPKGVRQVEYIVEDPVWYKPNWVWLERGLEIPEEITMEDRAVPGVLGPYKVSIGEGYYIHGTRSGRIRPGKYSHGCVRMNNKDLRQLVKMIDEGTMVYIY